MGKALRVLAIAESDAEANAYMATHDEAACIACWGHLVVMAGKYDQGIALPPGGPVAESTTGARVYLLCYAHDPYRARAGHGIKVARHYLGVTRLSVADRLAQFRIAVADPSTIQPGAGRLVPSLLAAGVQPVVADVWECADLEEAHALKASLRTCGSRGRICSICSPGNLRGRGKGAGVWKRWHGDNAEAALVASIEAKVRTRRRKHPDPPPQG